MRRNAESRKKINWRNGRVRSGCLETISKVEEIKPNLQSIYLMHFVAGFEQIPAAITTVWSHLIDVVDVHDVPLDYFAFPSCPPQK